MSESDRTPSEAPGRLVSRVRPAGRLVRIALAAALAGMHHTASAAQQTPPPPTANQANAAEPADDPIAALLDPATPGDRRPTLAAAALQDLDAVVQLLTQAGASGASLPVRRAARELLVAARQTSPPPVLITPTADLARSSDLELAIEALRTLAGLRTRESAAALVGVLADDRLSDRHADAHAALVTLTGRADVAPASWSAWLAEALTLTERQWEAALLASHVATAKRFAARSGRAEQRLADAWRRIHLLTPQEERGDVLAQLLRDESAALRSLGFELVSREIGENRRPGPQVVEAAVALLAHEQPDVRAEAALLLHRLAPPEAEAPVLAALQRETDPRAADALLLAVSRWPSPAAVQPTLRWLRDEPRTRVRAASSAWALYRAGALDAPEDRAAILECVRPIPDAQLSSAASRLLVTLGDAEDLDRLGGLLTAEDRNVRVTAADALALRADQVERLLDAATEDPTLFESCAKALQTHLHDARGYDALRRLPAPEPRVRARVLSEYAELLPTGEILRLARLTPDPSERVSLLAPLLGSDRAGQSGAAPELIEGLVLLAETRVALADPAEALRALESIPEPGESEPAADQQSEEQGAGATSPPDVSESDLRDQADQVRVAVLLWLNRPNDAEPFDAPVEAWLRGLELAIAEPFAPDLARRLAQRFPELTEEQADRFAALQSRLAAATPGPESSAEGG